MNSSEQLSSFYSAYKSEVGLLFSSMVARNNTKIGQCLVQIGMLGDLALRLKAEISHFNQQRIEPRRNYQSLYQILLSRDKVRYAVRCYTLLLKNNGNVA